MLLRFKHSPVRQESANSLVDLERDVESLFDSLFDAAPGVFSARFPAVDIAEYPDRFVIVAELPGVTKDQVKLSLEEGVLTVSGERTLSGVSENSTSIRKERAAGRFSRSISVPRQVNGTDVTAELQNGILRITLPKAEAARARDITIQ